MLAIIVVDYGEFTSSHECDRLSFAIHHDAYRKETLVHLACTPPISVLNVHGAAVYAIVSDKKLFLGMLIDVYYGTDSCVLVLKPTNETLTRLLEVMLS